MMLSDIRSFEQQTKRATKKGCKYNVNILYLHMRIHICITSFCRFSINNIEKENIKITRIILMVRSQIAEGL